MHVPPSPLHLDRLLARRGVPILTSLSWLLCLWLVTPRAQAQQSSPSPGAVSERDRQARALFEQGRGAYSDGRYRDAWAYFHEAYQLSGRPELLFNIGQTADRLGQAADAIKAFTMYLERLPNAANRRDVDDRVRALRERIAAAQQASTAPPALSTTAPVRAAPVTSPANASVPTAAAPTPPASSTAPVPQPREPRRGFYLRASIGAGFRADAISQTYHSNQSALVALETTNDYALSGGGLAFDLAAGWGVLPGFVVGGGLFLDWTSSPSLSEKGGPKSTLATANLSTIGPFIDWYPFRKTLGWHIMTGFGLAVLRYNNQANNGDGIAGTGYGGSLLLGTGYEFKLSPTTALGVELRFTAAVLGESADMQDTSHVFTSPSLLASFTWF